MASGQSGLHGDLLGVLGANRVDWPSQLPNESWPNVMLEDLTVGGGSYTINAGNAINLKVFYQNYQNTTDLKFFLDDNTNPYDGYTQLPNQANNLQASSSIKSTTIPLSGSFDGYYLGVEATDTNNARNRYDYLPERLTVNPVSLKPDFSVTSVSIPTQAAPGATIPVTFTVQNNGSGASGFLENEVSLLYGTPLTQIVLGEYSMSGIAPNGQRTVTIDINLPAALTPGDYSVAVHADKPGTVAELNESNNVGDSSPSLLIILPVTYAIAVAETPVGSGTISGGGNYNSGDAVTLLANPNPGFTFVNWTENGNSVSNTASYSFTAYGDRNLEANFIATPTIVHNLNTTGINGTVIRIPDLPQYGDGSLVTLYALPNTGYKFSGWSGDIVSSSQLLTVTMNSDKSFNANFIPIEQEIGSLRVSIVPQAAIGAGAQWRLVGETTWRPSGDTIPDLPYGTYVAEFNNITGWITPGNQSISVSASDPNAWFNSATYVQIHDLSVSLAGSGTVTSTPTGIDCNPSCLASFTDGTQVLLDAYPANGWVFAGWSGACSGVGTCTVPMITTQSVDATFVAGIFDGDLAPWDNPDGQINAADVLIATQLVLGQRMPGLLQYVHGDMNQDSVIDLADLLLIQKTALQ